MCVCVIKSSSDKLRHFSNTRLIRKENNNDISSISLLFLFILFDINEMKWKAKYTFKIVLFINIKRPTILKKKSA